MTTVSEYGQEPEKCPYKQNPTFVPCDVEIEKFETKFDFLLFIYNFAIQGKMSAANTKIHISRRITGPL